MKPLSPEQGAEWVRENDFAIPGRTKAEAWTNPEKGLFVLSSVDRSGKRGRKEYHLSVSFAQGRCPDEEVMSALRAFGMTSAEEDNSGGRMSHVRHFWQAVPGKK